MCIVKPLSQPFLSSILCFILQTFPSPYQSNLLSCNLKQYEFCCAVVIHSLLCSTTDLHAIFLAYWEPLKGVFYIDPQSLNTLHCVEQVEVASDLTYSPLPCSLLFSVALGNICRQNTCAFLLFILREYLILRIIHRKQSNLVCAY